MRWWVERNGARLEVAVRRLGDAFEVTLDGVAHVVELLPVGDGVATLLWSDRRSYAVVGQMLDRGRWRLSFGQMDFEVTLRDPLERAIHGKAAGPVGRQEVRAPIPGKVAGVLVQVGDQVAAGATILVLEAMKMENQIASEGAGTIAEVLVEVGATVEGGQLLAVVE